MKKEVKKGLSFGLTSSVITVLGLITGLSSATHSKLAIIGGVIIIAFADSLSDAFAMHISEESEKKNTERQVWQITYSTVFYKLIFALSFLIPLLLLGVGAGILASLIWGGFLLIMISLFVAKYRKTSKFNAIFSHLIIAILVIILSYFIGFFVNKLFI